MDRKWREQVRRIVSASIALGKAMSAGFEQKKPQFFARGLDHLGTIATLLEGMQGYDTLIRELVQNADDVPGASRISFQLTNDALIVDNDAAFKSCGHLLEQECPWSTSAIGRRCDFHRMQRVGGADKRNELDTTGSFGIGFTSVYLVTNYPEIISSGHHWILREDEDYRERIYGCPGCSACLASSLPPTRFVFPWAFGKRLPIRERLRVPAIEPTVVGEFQAALERTLPNALLFLQRLNSATVIKEGNEIRRFVRTVSGTEAEVTKVDVTESCEGGRASYLLLNGDFATKAVELSAKLDEKLKGKRKPTVRVAIGKLAPSDGLLFACLPTTHRSGLSFHVDAQFFPHPDRKRILFEENARSDWNRAALEAAAKALAVGAEKIRDQFDHLVLWEIIGSAKSVHEDVDKFGNDRAFKEFWEKMSTMLKKQRIVLTTTGEWVLPAESRFPQKDADPSALETAAILGVKIPHLELRPRYNEMKALGATDLTIEDIAVALVKNGVDRPMKLDQLPDKLQVQGSLTALRVELCRMLQIQLGKAPAKGASLRNVALAPVSDSEVAPLRMAFRGDAAARKLFQRISAEVYFLIDESEQLQPLWSLCPVFDATHAVELLEKIAPEAINRMWKSAELEVGELFAFMESNWGHPADAVKLRKRLSALPIFPTGSRLVPLAQASLPGDFVDRLGLATVLDMNVLAGRDEFLRSLGATELSFREYVTDHLPRAMRSDSLAPDVVRSVVSLLLARFETFESDDKIRGALTSCKIVECVDLTFRLADEVYLDTPVNRQCMGSAFSYALLPEEQSNTVIEFYKWLGVAAAPRPSDVIEVVSSFSSTPPNEESLRTMRAIFDYLSRQDEEDLDDYKDLRRIAWLPARGHPTQWFKPSEVYAAYMERLFSTQGKFLELTKDLQDRADKLRPFLGIETKPEPEQVVSHLITCAGTGRPVDLDVYKFLADCSSHMELLRLRGLSCLLVKGKYVLPAHAYWGEHAFRRFRWSLPSAYREYEPALKQIGVRETPSLADALSVLEDVSRDYGRDNRDLSDEDRPVVEACWASLDKALAAKEIDREPISALGARRCIPTRSNVLQAPRYLLFEDRVDLSKRFGSSLDGTVIRRPVEGVKAMESAGVRNLSSVTRVEIISFPIAASVAHVHELLIAREELIARVIAATSGDEVVRDALRKLRRLRIFGGTELRVRFHVEHNGIHLSSAEAAVKAVCKAEEDSMFFEHTEGSPPWPAIAREIASYLLPDTQSADLASGLCHALEPMGFDAAVDKLDLLGFANVDVEWGLSTAEKSESEDSRIERSSTEDVSNTSALGVDATGGEVVAGEKTSPVAARGKEAKENGSKESSAGTPGDARPSGRDKKNNSTEVSAPILRRSESSETSVPKTTEARPRSSGSYRPRPLSFIVVERDENGSGTSSNGNARNRAIGDAGEAFAAEWERKRRPLNKVVRLPHHHKGYDILSEGDSERRRIEVKSFVGQWPEDGVAVSGAQFYEALRGDEQMDNWWLYVVEYAESPSLQKLTAIQNPFLVASKFYIDPGWRNAPSSDGTSVPDVSPMVGAEYEIGDGDVVKISQAEKRGKFWQVSWVDAAGARREGIWHPTWRRR